MGGFADARPLRSSHRHRMQTTTTTTGKRSPSRHRLLVDLPTTERSIDVAGISTSILEGGAGSPVILLHGPAAHAAAWMRVLPALVRRHRVIVPDLPGHGASGSVTPMTVERMIAWLGELITKTCASPPAVVGHALGGAIAARFAAAHGDAIRQLILVDTFGLTPFQPVPEFGQAIRDYFENPRPESHHELWRYCAHDIESVRRQMGERWQPFEDYNLELVRTPSVMDAASSMLTLFASSAIPDAELANRGDRSGLGTRRPRDPARGRRGSERALSLAAPRDRRMCRRSPDREAAGPRAHIAQRDRRIGAVTITAPAVRRSDATGARHAFVSAWTPMLS
jgi:pimeloyl-ACP methyl ester carboxylesterase